MKRSFAIVCLVLPLGVWLAYALVGHRLASGIAEHWGPQLLQAGDGKFTDPVIFLQHRFHEGAWLLSLVAALVLAVFASGSLVARRMPQLWRWVPYAVAGFVGLNVWIKLASGTCLFWCLFWNGRGTTDNLTQFHIKQMLIDENKAPLKVVVGGSSQAHAQIDTRLLNRLLRPGIFTTELHFPGSHAYDFLFLDRALWGHKAQVVVCYLSELNFFGQGLSEGFSLFFRLDDLPEFLRLGGRLGWSPRCVGYGFLADLLPIFGVRDCFARRLVGGEAAGLRQHQHDEALKTDLEERAAEVATAYQAGEQSRFEMAAFEEFVLRCRARRQTVVLCCGQFNPILGRKLSPELRPQMLAFLRQLAAKYDNVRLLDESDLPAQTADDYQDLTHVKSETQTRFTRTIARTLEHLAGPEPLQSASRQ